LTTSIERAKLEDFALKLLLLSSCFLLLFATLTPSC